MLLDGAELSELGGALEDRGAELEEGCALDESELLGVDEMLLDGAELSELVLEYDVEVLLVMLTELGALEELDDHPLGK